MGTTLDLIKAVMAVYEAENAKFVAGNASAGTRARKALGELGKLTKVARAEITTVKNERKAAK